ncbi:hypothetical protein [Ottowia sp.]|uniref:hypothetical protein n=1 Tax=Ottowia sp. TaxID=1898956 RepID=UPI003A847336
MKKSILAIGAAAVVGGLGFAGSAQAVVLFGDVAATPRSPLVAATDVVQNPGSIGHFLFAPYFTANESMNTLIAITNTDETNGKAVKVRFRGAANSDDVLDFTVFLSPGDVWTGSVARDGNTNHAVITTEDNSCTIPVAADWPGVFSANRLGGFLSSDVAAANTREGYIEVLNMADIPPSTVTGSLYKGIKHVNGEAPCSSIPYADMLSTTVDDATNASAHGLAAPSGGLMGTWGIVDHTQIAMFSGNMTAITASSAVDVASGTTTSGYGYIAFAPQVGLTATQAVVDANTADPLLTTTGIAISGITPLWYDLPDMSTPLTSTYAHPGLQADRLSATLAKGQIYNDYMATASGAALALQTDWVVSQPTRRYHAAVAYGTTAASSVPVYVDHSAAVVGTADTSVTTATGLYSSLNLNTALANGPMLCLGVAFSSADREETFTTLGGSFSPGVTSPYCGEVFTVSFGATKVLRPNLTNRTVTPVGEYGWARLALPTAGTALPMVGFAASGHTSTNGNYGMTLPHRWGSN